MNSDVIRSKGSKNVRENNFFRPLINKENMSKRNIIKMEEFKKIEEESIKKNTIQFNKIFSKERMITYLYLTILPPYGMYRVWHKSSTFSTVEKYLWTFIFVIFIIKFTNLIF